MISLLILSYFYHINTLLCLCSWTANILSKLGVSTAVDTIDGDIGDSSSNSDGSEVSLFYNVLGFL